MKNLKKVSLLAVVVLFSMTSMAQTKNSMDKKSVKAESVSAATPTIVGVAVSNKNFTTLVAAAKAAGLVETLSGTGPFTVFAPTNDAFAKLPEGTVSTLLEPSNKGTLTSILTYHVVAGKFEAAAVIEAIKANNGAFQVATVQGGNITLSLKGGNVVLTDEKGGTATVVIADVQASNGVIHAVDTVVMPK